MKKIIIILISIGVMNSGLFADFKIMGGLNLSKYNILWEDENTEWNYKMGFLVGIGLEKNLTHNVILEFDILFFKKGCSVEFSDFPDLKAKYDINAISIPFLLRIKNMFSYGSSPYFLGGIEISAILSHKVKFEKEMAMNIKNHTKSTDFGLVFGCGYEIEMQEQLYFFIEARYHLGIRNIMSNPSEEHGMKTNAILIMIGVRS